jgi:hypothetical protein
LAGCSAAAKNPTFPPLPPTETKALLVGARCHGDKCVCRDAGTNDKEESPPAAGMKRFEFRVGTGPGRAWITVDGQDHLYKSSETAEECYYLDLNQGTHHIEVRTHATEPQGGFGVALKVSEHGPKDAWWYDTFHFQCGMPGPCSTEDLHDWKQAMEKLYRHEQDPCGSVKIHNANWITGRVPDAQHPEEIDLTFDLRVYPFAPHMAPGDAACKKGGE